MAERWLRVGRLVTCDGDDDDPLAVAEDASLLLQNGRVAEIGPGERAPADALRVPLVTPGLVDAHTHAVWAGSRGREYALRMAGADYEAIAASGGGIVASMRAVRASSRDELAATLAARLRRMAAMGVTRVEVKSGYGLDEANERKQLEAVADVAQRADVPAVVPTYLGLHAVPPTKEGGAGDKDEHARRCRDWLEGIATDGLAAFVDAYVDRSAFSVSQARPTLERARELGLGVRLHVGQFADVGGAELAAAVGAASVDHAEHVGPAGIAALADGDVAVGLLPVASFTLGQEPPPVAAFRDAGLRLVVASDANPGTAPTESLPLAMAFAVRSYGLTVAEAVLGATRHAARSLGVPDEGRLHVGGPGDLVAWDLAHEAELIQPWGLPRTLAVYRAGVRIA